MSTAVQDDINPQDRPAGERAVDQAQQVEAAAPAAPAGDPAMLGLPTFIVGSIALGLTLIGYVPAAAQAGALPIILAATALGLFISTSWAIRLGASAVACIFGFFGAFWLSFSLLLLGLGHNWYGIVAADIKKTVMAFLLTWVIGVAMLTLVTLRLPLAFTALFVLVDLALILVLLSTDRASTGLAHAAGVVVFAFAALGAYLFAGSASVATGGQPMALGKPLMS